LRFTNYIRHFVFNYAKIAEPLYKKLKSTSNTLKWEEKEKAGFENVKNAIESLRQLKSAKKEDQLYLATDSSGSGIEGGSFSLGRNF
jgi:hypothetical protein